MKLYDLPQRADPPPKIYKLEPNGYKNGIVEFHHLDGAYSFCVAYDDAGIEIGPVHLSAATPLKPYKDGWVIAEDDDEVQHQ